MRLISKSFDIKIMNKLKFIGVQRNTDHALFVTKVNKRNESKIMCFYIKKQWSEEFERKKT